MRRPSLASPDATRPGWRRLASAASWVALAVAAFLIWPVSLGGSMSYVFVSGESMTPAYQPGDLVIARKGEVSVGDVIIYAPEGFGGAQVVHRVIGGSATDGWVVQGDANDFVDPFTPRGDEVRGVVIAHLPWMGSAMRVALSPFLWIGVLLLAAAFFVWPSRSEDEPGHEDAKENAALTPQDQPELVEAGVR